MYLCMHICTDHLQIVMYAKSLAVLKFSESADLAEFINHISLGMVVLNSRD